MIYEEVHLAGSRNACRTLTGAARVLFALKIDGPLVVGLALVAAYGLDGAVQRLRARACRRSSAHRARLGDRHRGDAAARADQPRTSCAPLDAVAVRRSACLLLVVVAAIGHIMAWGRSAGWTSELLRFQPSELGEAGRADDVRPVPARAGAAPELGLLSVLGAGRAHPRAGGPGRGAAGPWHRRAHRHRRRAGHHPRGPAGCA